MKIIIPLSAALLLGHGACKAQVVDNTLDLWAAHGQEYGVSIKPYVSGGYLVFANSNQSADTGLPFPYVVHLDDAGNADWNRIYLPDSTENGLHFSAWDGVDQASGSGYVAAGLSTLPGAGNYRGFVLRIDEQGNEMWRRDITYGTHSTYFNSARFTPDGGCLVIGTYFVSSGYRSMVVRLDASGNEVWNRMILPSGGGIAAGLMVLPDGGFVLCGKQGSGDAYTPWYGRFDPDGDLVWDHALPPVENPREFFQIRAYGPNTYALLGSEKGGYESYRSLFAMIDSTGALNWLTPVGRFDGWEGFTGIECVPGQGILGYGHGREDHPGVFCPQQQGYLVSMSVDGDSLAALKVSHVFDVDSLTYLGVFQGIQATSDGRLFAVGWTTSWPWQGWDTQEDLWVYGLGAEDCLFPDCGPPGITTPVEEHVDAMDRMECSPNPINTGGTLAIRLPSNASSNENGDVSLMIYGADGRKAAEFPLENAPKGSISVPIGNLRPGAYTLMFSDRKDFPYVSRFVVM